MVERCLAKANVAGSNPVFRSIKIWRFVLLRHLPNRVPLKFQHFKGRRKPVVRSMLLRTAKHAKNGVFVAVAGSNPVFRSIKIWRIANLVPSPSGKAKVCKTFITRFKSGWYLQLWRPQRSLCYFKRL